MINEVNGNYFGALSNIDNTLGNILIKHNDKWRGDYYLKPDLTFTIDKSQAGKFYILKAGDTTILNGDRVSINMGSRTLVVDSNGTLRLADREHLNREINTFVITNGTPNTDPITYESSLFFISDKNNNMALKYEWGMSLVSEDMSTYHPRDCPNLINATYHNDGDTSSAFQFAFERSDIPITRSEIARTITISSPTNYLPIQEKRYIDFIDDYKGVVMVILLMVILILCVLASKY